MLDIYFIRHGETDANAAGVWQGQGDTDLNERGRSQATSLGERLRGIRFDRVECSDLSRATSSARIAGLDPHPASAWREVEIGHWEGLTRDQVHDRFGAELAALDDDPSAPLGGGESWPGFEHRIDRALDDLIDRAGSGRVAVVAHGGVIHAVVSQLLDLRTRPRPWPIERLSNTSITVVRVEGTLRQLYSFNDARHVDKGPTVGDEAVLALIRHGETISNIEGRWAGTFDAQLTDQGRQQALDLPQRYNGAMHVYSSPLSRSLRTAEAFAGAHRLDITVVDDLREIYFGAWENLTSEEIAALDPDGWRRFQFEGIDERRGGDGETAAQAAARFRAALADIADRHQGEQVAVVAHGGVIRAYLGTVMELGHADRHRLALMSNTAVAHVRIGDTTTLLDYNLGRADQV